MDPASIRSNNPGAMWGKGNPIATKWGSTATEDLADGLGQGNNIAHFPDRVHGAAAQFDLWRQHYTSMTLQAAIKKWSGGNWSQPYADFLVKRTGLAMATEMTPAILSSPQGLELMQAQAQWEAGVPYPMSLAEWQQAQGMVFGQGQALAQAMPIKPAVNTNSVISLDIPVGMTLLVNGRPVSY